MTRFLIFGHRGSPPLAPEGRLTLAQDFSPGTCVITKRSPVGTIENVPIRRLQSSLRDLQSAAASHPGLKSWAKVNRPSGALPPNPFLSLRSSARAVRCSG